MEKGLPIDERKSADHALSCRSIPAKLIPAGNRDFGPSLFLKTEMGERSGSTEGPLLRRRSKWGGGAAALDHIDIPDQDNTKTSGDQSP